MIIRKTSGIVDIPRCLECAEKFHVEYEDKPFSEKSFIDFWLPIISEDKGFILLAEDSSGRVAGGIGIVEHNPQTSDYKIGTEAFWYVLPEYRSVGHRLLVEAEKLAKQRGCKRMCMILMSGVSDSRVEKAYQSRGYREYEKVFIKELT